MTYNGAFLPQARQVMPVYMHTRYLEVVGSEWEGIRWDTTLARQCDSGFLDLKSYYLTLDEIALLHTELLYNLEVLLDSQLLLKKQVAAMAQKAFVQVYFVSQLHSISPGMVTHALVTPNWTAATHSTWRCL